MAIHIFIKSGEKKGKSFNVKDGMRIGREGQDVNLEDPKASTLHAMILKDRRGRYFIVDQKSRNGLKDEKGKKQKKIELKPETQFKIGDTVLTIKKGRISRKVNIAKQKPAPAKVEIDPHWNEILAKFTKPLISQVKNNYVDLKPLGRPMKLTFFRGLQVETQWILGYGPRTIGAEVIDLNILEPSAPAQCFEILPNGNENLFRTKHPELVKVNGVSHNSHTLKEGDIINIKSTFIEVNYINE